MSANSLLFRADASSAIGMGHAMRCLALAETYSATAGGRSVFLMARPLPAFTERAGGAGAEVRALAAPPGSAGDVNETLATAADLGTDWLVLDGYQFDGAFQAALVDAGHRVLALDDHGHAGRYHAELVLNQNAGADPALYREREPATRLLLGPKYALLREEFRTMVRPAPGSAGTGSTGSGDARRQRSRQCLGSSDQRPGCGSRPV